MTSIRPAQRLPMIRAGWRLWPLLLVALLVLACAQPAPGVDASGPRDAAPIELAPGVYLLPGMPGGVDARTRGRVGNTGFIVGEQGVLAIDTGTSWRQGQALLQAIERITDRPVQAVLVTHTQKEFLFGAMAFRERGIPIHMHREANALMQSRCARCLRVLRETLGDEEMRGTAMFEPDRLFEGPQQIDLGGRRVRLIDTGHSSGPGSMMVLDERSGVLFAGGLLSNGRIPETTDADLPGWQAMLVRIAALPVRRIVPGHGPAGGSEMITAQQTYLRQLAARVEVLLDQGAALSEVPTAAALPDFAAWDQYPALHQRNASALLVKRQQARIAR